MPGVEAPLIVPLDLAAALSARPATIHDIDSVTALIAACELDDDGVADIDRDDIASDFAAPRFDPELDAVLVFDGAELVAWAQMRLPSGSEADVHPTHRGRGIGAAMLDWTESRARALGRPVFGQTKTDANPPAAELFRQHGYAPERTAWLLEILLEERAVDPDLSAGIELRPFVPGRDDHEVYRLIDDAFNEWPDRESTSFEFWSSVTIGRATFAPELSPLAVDGDEIVGAVLCLDFGTSEGYVHQVAVRRSHRGRGIARGLLAYAFGEWHRRGAGSCTLSTDSRTGALSLYEKVGMHAKRSYTHYAKRL
jgi:mycothiol synthase